MEDERERGWDATRILEWVIVGAVSVPVVAGFVTLGAAVVVARSVRELARTVWTWMPGRDAAGAPADGVRSNAA